MVALIVRDINSLVHLLVHHLLFVLSLALAHHSVWRHHSCAADLLDATCVAIPFVVLAMSHGCRWYHVLVRRLSLPITRYRVQVLVALARILDCAQLGEIVCVVPSCLCRLVHHLLSGLVLAASTASYIVFALIVVDGAVVFGTCDTAGPFSGPRKTTSFSHVAFIRCGLGLRM